MIRVSNKSTLSELTSAYRLALRHKRELGRLESKQLRAIKWEMFDLEVEERGYWFYDLIGHPSYMVFLGDAEF